MHDDSHLGFQDGRVCDYCLAFSQLYHGTNQITFYWDDDIYFVSNHEMEFNFYSVNSFKLEDNMNLYCSLPYYSYTVWFKQFCSFWIKFLVEFSRYILKFSYRNGHLEFLWSSVAQSLVFCVVCCWLLFVPFLLVIALSVILLLWYLITSNCYLQIFLIIFNQMLKYWIEQIPNL